MADDLTIVQGTKEEQYRNLLPQIEALLHGESNIVANMANVCAALKEQFGWLWVGFYLVDTPEELVLGPFQGPVACTRIKKGRGVCGTSWATNSIQIVPDVHAFPGHIACSSASLSEIVLPWQKNGEILGVLDVDAASYSVFDEVDASYLTKILALL
ncbi:MAG: GAF domain-containing protein [Bacteroidetes bacterium]|nr:MAG: GAF domain-containing protein [Bacteroidota bacterium]TAE72479.1 MAG: GAF domain-containing protein [Bacteroidota bacterium]TAF93499.1 MAG: GAF domain-containing protein [Bacteroidota bacterium]